MMDDDDLDLMDLDQDDTDLGASFGEDDDMGAPEPAAAPQGAPKTVGQAMGGAAGVTGGQFEAVYDIPVNVSAVLGKASMQVSQLLKLGRGAVVELDRKVGEAIDIYVNNRLVARGEVVVVDDKLGITLTEIVRTEG